MAKVLLLLRHTVREFQEDDCTHMAAGVAYYAMFSIFPLLLGLVAVLGMLLDADALQAQLADAVSAVLPGTGDLVTSTVRGVVAARGSMGIVAVAGLFWSASAIFAAIRRSVNLAWDVPRSRPFLKQKAIDLAMILGTGLLFVLSFGTTAAYRALSELEIPLLALGTVGASPLWQPVGFVLPLLFTFAIFASVYRFLPNTRVAWGDVWPGALVGSVAFEVAKYGFVLYLEHFATYNLVYGPLTSVIAFLFWAYISALVLLFGAELSSEYARLYGSHARG